MEEKSGVYIIPYKDKKKLLNYVGMTTRRFLTRLKEHKQDIVKERPRTALSRLYQSKDIEVLFKEAKIIMRATDFDSCAILESLEILTQAKNCCDDVLSYKIPHIWFNLLKVTGEFGASED